MKSGSVALVLVSISLILATFGCTPSLQMTKPSSTESPGPEKPASASDKSTASASEKPGETQIPPPPPDYKPPSLSDGPLEGPPDLSWKDDINAAALEFAKNFRNVKHVKTCFSKLYGGWYLILYIEKAKKVGLHMYSWDAKSREWEPSFQQEEIPPKQLEFQVKGEVEGEKCFVLK